MGASPHHEHERPPGNTRAWPPAPTPTTWSASPWHRRIGVALFCADSAPGSSEMGKYALIAITPASLLWPRSSIRAVAPPCAQRKEAAGQRGRWAAVMHSSHAALGRLCRECHALLTRGEGGEGRAMREWVEHAGDGSGHSQFLTHLAEATDNNSLSGNPLGHLSCNQLLDIPAKQAGAIVWSGKGLRRRGEGRHRIAWVTRDRNLATQEGEHTRTAGTPSAHLRPAWRQWLPGLGCRTTRSACNHPRKGRQCLSPIGGVVHGRGCPSAKTEGANGQVGEPALRRLPGLPLAYHGHAHVEGYGALGSGGEEEAHVLQRCLELWC